MRKLTAFEETIKTHLVDGVPPHKYQLWQMTSQGQIVGLEYDSVAYCYENNITPGWYYTIENDGNHSLIHENKIQLVQEVK